jgi:hypothetical protein
MAGDTPARAETATATTIQVGIWLQARTIGWSKRPPHQARAAPEPFSVPFVILSANRAARRHIWPRESHLAPRTRIKTAHQEAGGRSGAWARGPGGRDGPESGRPAASGRLAGRRPAGPAGETGRRSTTGQRGCRCQPLQAGATGDNSAPPRRRPGGVAGRAGSWRSVESDNAGKIHPGGVRAHKPMSAASPDTGSQLTFSTSCQDSPASSTASKG